jgi:hypothetical protein
LEEVAAWIETLTGVHVKVRETLLRSPPKSMVCPAL